VAHAYYDKFKVKSVGTSRGGWTKETDADGRRIYTCIAAGSTATVNFEDGTAQAHPPGGAGPLKPGSKIIVHKDGRAEVEEDV
jgi:hypothetical protein